MFDEFSVVPTYLVTYPVATNRESVEILKDILQRGKCEIGMHCHPWSTPPFDEERNSFNSMLCNLEPALQYEKMRALHRIIYDMFGETPISFRAGRWAYSKDVIHNLIKLGHRVDSSVFPLTDWSNHFGPDMSRYSSKPFAFETLCPVESATLAERSSKQLLELPVTVGFLQPCEMLCNHLYKMLEKRPLRVIPLRGIFRRLNILNKVYLTPELSDARNMIRLAEVMIKRRDYSVLNMFFHSTSLKQGLSPFVKSEEDERLFWQRIKDFLQYSKERRIQPIKLKETASLISDVSIIKADMNEAK